MDSETAETAETHSKAVLCNADKNTILAALTHYIETGGLSFDTRSAGVTEIATGAVEELEECISLDFEGVADLIRTIKSVDGVEFR